jgi:glycosyltransferase involved in cell wall biosynthesis
MTNILFMTHVGVPGGAEFKMIDLAECVAQPSEVLLMEHGALEALLEKRGIACSVNELPRAARSVRREGGISALLRAIPATLSIVRGVARKARDFRVVVCFSQKSFVVAALAKPFMRRPVFWFMNDILSQDHFNPVLVRFLVALSRIAADHVILNSEASMKAWLDSGGRKDRVSIIHPMTRSDQVAAQTRDIAKVAAYRKLFSRDDRPLIGMFGRICPWKGQDVFLRAIAQVPGANAVIAGGALFGEEAHEARMKALAHELGVANRVTFAGHVEEVAAIMSACEVVVHCSTAPEPFGRVIVESMFVGTPVIASDAGGAREIVTHGETGQLTPMSDAPALAAAIRRYLADPSWSRAVAAKAQTEAERRFSATAMMDRFNEILLTV